LAPFLTRALTGGEDHLGGVVVRPAANGFEVVVFHSSIKQRS